MDAANAGITEDQHVHVDLVQNRENAARLRWHEVAESMGACRVAVVPVLREMPDGPPMSPRRVVAAFGKDHQRPVWAGVSCEVAYRALG